MLILTLKWLAHIFQFIPCSIFFQSYFIKICGKIYPLFQNLPIWKYVQDSFSKTVSRQYLRISNIRYWQYHTAHLSYMQLNYHKQKCQLSAIRMTGWYGPKFIGGCSLGFKNWSFHEKFVKIQTIKILMVFSIQNRKIL